MAPASTGQRIVVVGAGPVGALAALYAAHRGDQVDIYELRSDLRYASTVPLNFTKSINLALSERGIRSMHGSQSEGVAERVLAETIPMYGRMIHGKDALGRLKEKSQTYDIHGRAIYAVDRQGLNTRLIDALEDLPNVRFFFNNKLTGADFRRKHAWFEDHSGQGNSSPGARAPEKEITFDLLIGADGAHSATRYHLMKYARVSYQQEYIDTLWCEFHIKPRDDTFAMSPNHLHIWPGRDFMFIAIPSLDRSFTCTLFAPQQTFDELSKNVEILPRFFDTNFPGVSGTHIDPKILIEQFKTNPHLPLVNIKCTPYHFGSSGVILGDAAHAMVPFYGQGMNAGLEDVRILFDILEDTGVYVGSNRDNLDELRAVALRKYTEYRIPDAHTINDLALQNYLEMRSGVVSPVYLIRKFIEETISHFFPASGWATQYSRISFSNERYSYVVRTVRQQGEALLLVLFLVAFFSTIIAAIVYSRWIR